MGNVLEQLKGKEKARDRHFKLITAIFRAIASYELIMYCAYFALRIYYIVNYTSWNRAHWTLGWMWFVLAIEMLGSSYGALCLIIRMRRPWTEFADQPDGPELFRKRILGPEQNELVAEQKSVAAAEDGNMDDASEMVAGESVEEHQMRKLEFHRRKSSVSSVDATEFKMPIPEGGIFQNVKDKFPGVVVRVLIPCYREPTDIVNKVVLAACKMSFDKDRLHVYLCDDGRDAKKEEWINELRNMGYNAYYIARPNEFKGHAKAGNLNYTLKHVIYKDGAVPDKKELITIFDADMIAFPEFLDKIIPYFLEDEKVVMVQSPQAFHNIPSEADFFDCQNKSFFFFTIPGLDSWDAVSCCGTNFMMSAKALVEVGFFPTASVTEDAYLSMRLHENKGRIRYHGEILAIGEAPEDLRQIFQQRSRWCKGSLQILLQNRIWTNPKLTLVQRYWFFGLAWSYIVSGVLNQIYTLILVVSLLFGVYPMPPLTTWSCAVFGLYFLSVSLRTIVTPTPRSQSKCMWYSYKGSVFFGWMSLKAIWNVTTAHFGFKSLTFKVTKKTVRIGNNGQTVARRDSSYKDIYFHIVMSVFLMFCVAYALGVIISRKSALPDVQALGEPGTGTVMRLISMSTCIQALTAYMFPVLYAVLPENHKVQSRALNVLMGVDIICILFSGILIAAFQQFGLLFKARGY
eukprot:TRINITY_DN381_c0_g1_i1.p1 TRINITY_DN381_c0_g1~~TRINITY_DN381_c0_g1_i1.p1  ORF type:complete len:715 (+),score=146.36 TRINITY_DN381_c0_g1_i1:89-2146(+)